MRNFLMFTYSILAYLIAFASLLLWILSVSHLIPEISIDQTPKMSFFPALLKNIGLVMLFGLQHSIMARKSFKDFFIKHFPKPIERSTYVLASGLLLIILVLQWEPMGGSIWNVEHQSFLYYSLYVLFFLGWGILFISTFLINHFDLFGLRQTYLELRNEPYTQLKFRVVGFYKYVRHPLYFGGILGLWATPTMTLTHLIFAMGLTSYFIIGLQFEENDMKKEFGKKYREYQGKTPMIIPFIKRSKNTIKNIILLVISVTAFNTLNAQQNDIASLSGVNNDYREPANIKNLKYLKEVNDSNNPQIVNKYQSFIATYNLMDNSIYDDSEKAMYEIEFKERNVCIKIIYSHLGEIISSDEEYKNIKIPHELSVIILKKYPDWTVYNSEYSVAYNNFRSDRKNYIVKLRNGELRKTIKFDIDATLFKSL